MSSAPLMDFLPLPDPPFIPRCYSLPSNAPLQAFGREPRVPDPEDGEALLPLSILPPFPPPAEAYGNRSASSGSTSSCHQHRKMLKGGKKSGRLYRHSIPSHRLNNYLKFLHELAAKGSTTAHLFSTAVISGSSSAPNLKEMPQPALDGTGETMTTQ